MFMRNISRHYASMKKKSDLIGFSTKLSWHTLAIKHDLEGWYLIVQGKIFIWIDVDLARGLCPPCRKEGIFLKV